MGDWLFKRRLDDGIIDELLKSGLFNDSLKKDIKCGEVFPAIRNNLIDFYYRGGRLFRFGNNGFETHVKYASVYHYDEDYVSERNLGKMVPIKGFSESYPRIKENCGRYTIVESCGVSKLYRFSPFVIKPAQYVLLDVEVSLKKTSGEEEATGFQYPLEDKARSRTDRIDILLYDTKDCVLHFIEAKDFSNSEIWSKTKPRVIGQVQKYNKQLAHREKEILETYSDYIDLINKMFGSDLLKPKELFHKTGLYIFGYDGYQERSVQGLKKKIKAEEIPVYARGNPDGINIATLWKETCI
jgi:hypothetical protein